MGCGASVNKTSAEPKRPADPANAAGFDTGSADVVSLNRAHCSDAPPTKPIPLALVRQKSSLYAGKPLNLSPVFAGAAVPESVLQTLGEANFSLVRYVLEKWPADKLAVRTCGRNFSGAMQQYSYGDVRSAAYFAANLMYEAGVRKGDKVLLLQWNSWECVVAYFGTHYLGAVAVMSLPTHHERRYLIKYTACKAIVAPQAILPALEPEIDDKTYVRVVLVTDLAPGEGFGKRSQQVRPCPVLAEAEDLHLDNKFQKVEGRARKYSLIEFDGSGRAPELSKGPKAEFESIRREDECLWYFTSGTTGKPKGCVHKQVDLAFAAETYGRLMGCEDGLATATDVVMAGPYAMGSNLIFPLALGSNVFLDHVVKTDLSDFPKETFPWLRKAWPDIFVTIPGTIGNLTRSLREDDMPLIEAMRKLRVITSAGAPMPPAVFCNFRSLAKGHGLGVQVLDGIGTSECQHIFISNTPSNNSSDRGSIGEVVQGYEIRLLNSEQVPLEDGTTGWKGELMVRTQLPAISVKYSNARPPAGTDYDLATKEANLPDPDDSSGAPWYITGDVALAKPEGDGTNFYLLGRTKDLATQIGGGGERGMGIEDYKRRAVANSLLFAVGLVDRSEEMCTALGSGVPGLDILADDGFPVSVSVGGETTCVYVLSVTDAFWPDASVPDAETFAKWLAYIKDQTGKSDAAIYFSRASAVPRTPPPLLKPKVGEMKKRIQGWIDSEQLAALDEAACLRMTRSLTF